MFFVASSTLFVSLFLWFVFCYIVAFFFFFPYFVLVNFFLKLCRALYSFFFFSCTSRLFAFVFSTVVDYLHYTDVVLYLYTFILLLSCSPSAVG